MPRGDAISEATKARPRTPGAPDGGKSFSKAHRERSKEAVRRGISKPGPAHKKNRAGERRERKCGSYPGTCVFLTCFRIIAGFPSPSMPDSEVSVGPTLRPCDCMFRRLLRPRTPLRGRFGIAARGASCRDNGSAILAVCRQIDSKKRKAPA